MTQYFIGSAIADGVSGHRSIVQLWNPADSGKIVKVSKMIIAQSEGGQSGYDLRSDINALPVNVPIIYGANKTLGQSDSVAQFRCNYVYPSNIPGRIIQEEWSSESFKDREYTFEPPISIPQGYGIHVTPSANGSYMIASFEFSEENV